MRMRVLSESDMTRWEEADLFRFKELVVMVVYKTSDPPLVHVSIRNLAPASVT
jgi:hypothetical protein